MNLTKMDIQQTLACYMKGAGELKVAEINQEFCDRHFKILKELTNEFNKEVLTEVKN